MTDHKKLAELPLSNGRMRQLAEWPILKLMERIAIAVVVFLAWEVWTAVHELNDQIAEIRIVTAAHEVRLDRAERDIQTLWRVNAGPDSLGGRP